MSKRASGDWVYSMRYCGEPGNGYPISHRQWIPLGYSQSHWRKIRKERQRPLPV